MSRPSRLNLPIPGLKLTPDLKPQGSLLKFQTAIAAGNGVDIAVVGDSVVEGMAATTLAQTWPRIMLDALRKKYQPSGVAGGVGYYPGYTAYGAISPWTYSGTTHNNGVGWGEKFEFIDVGKSMSVPVKATRIDLIWTRTGGTVTATIDGANAVAFGGTGTFVSHQVTTLTAGLTGTTTQTLNLAGTSGTGGVWFEGIMIYNGDELTGIRLWPGARTGITAQQFAGNTGWSTALTTIAPELVVVAIGFNDRNANRTKAQFRADLETMKTAIRTNTAATLPSIVYMAYYEPSIAATYPWQIYLEAMYESAIADGNIAVYNAWARMGSITGAPSGFYFDTQHPNAPAHGVLGNDFADWLTRLAA